MDYDKLLAKHTKDMDTSAIRELLKLTSQPGMISLAGGMPSPDSFPVDAIKKLFPKVLSKYGPRVFQYQMTEGLPLLRAALANYLKVRKINVSENEVFISTGSQTALDAAAKVLLDPGDTVAVESPTFLAAVKGLKTYGANFITLQTDEDGVLPSEIAKLKNKKVKMIYLIPTFQNPTGATLTLKRRKEIAQIIKRHKLLVVEDDPYFELRYSGKVIPPIYSFAPQNVVYLGSLSKVFSPGMRLGYYLGPEKLTSLMTSVRQAVDVHANSLAQALAADYISEGYLANQIPKIVSLYRPRLETMLKALEKHMPASFSWTVPDGGMFVWVRGPKDFDANQFHKKVLSKKVAYVPGKTFYADKNPPKNTFRLNFTNVSEGKIKKGILIIGSQLKQF